MEFKLKLAPSVWRHSFVCVLTTCLVPFLVATPSLAQRASQVVDNQEPAYKEALSKQFGPLVEQGSRPATFRLIDSLLKPLASGMRILDRDRSTHLIYPYMIDSQRLINDEQLKQNGNVDSHLLVLSTTFLDNLAITDSTVAGYSQSYYNLAGTLAYLLAKGLVEKEHPDMSKKEVHLRAAVKGTELATQSGLPNDCIYKMLEWLLRNNHSRRTLIRTLFDEMPQLDLQLSAIRTYIVSKSYHLGQAIQTSGVLSDVRLIKDVVEEVEAKKSEVKWKFSPPRNLSEAVERISGLHEAKEMTEEFKRIEFHRLLTFAMDLANRIFISLGSLGQELQTYEKLVDFLLSNASPYTYENSMWGTYITNFPVENVQVDWPKTEYGRSWERALRDGAFFRSQEYRVLTERKLKEKYEFVVNHEQLRNVSASQKWGEFLRYIGTGVVLPETAMNLSKEMGKRALQEMEMSTDVRGSGIGMEFGLALSKASIPVQFEITSEIYRQILSKNTMAERLKIHAGSNYLELLPLPVIRPPRKAEKEPDEKAKEVELVWNAFKHRVSSGDAHAKEVVDAYLALIDDYWNNRAQYALADLAADDKIYWGWIGQLKGLSYDQTTEAIRKSVREFLEGDPDVAPTGSQVSYKALLQALAGKKASSKLEKIHVPWLDETIRPLLRTKLQDKSDEAKTASALIDSALIRFNPALVKDEYSRQASKDMNNGKSAHINYDLIKKWHQNALTAAFHSSFESVSASNNPLFLRLLVDQMVKELPKPSLDISLTEIFLNDQDEGLHGGRHKLAWTTLAQAREADKNYYIELLIQRKLIPKASFMLERLLTSKEDKDYCFKSTEVYSGELADLFPSLKIEAEGLKKLEEIRSFMDLLAPSKRLEAAKDDSERKKEKGKSKHDGLTGQGIELKRILLENASKLNLNYKQSSDLFKLATVQGPTQATDNWFYVKLWPSLKRDLRGYRSLRRYLGYKDDIRDEGTVSLIKSAVIRQEVASHLLEPKIAALAKVDDVDVRSLQALLSELDVYLSERSLRKDELLENLSFRLNIRDEGVLRDFIEARKLVGTSSNTTPVNAALHSSFTQLLSDLDESARLELISFMREPEDVRNGLPQSLLNKIEDQIISEEFAKGDTGRGKQTITEIARRQTMKTKEEIESILRDSSPLERIVIYDLLITSGPYALNNKADYISTITEKFLGIKPDSSYGRAIITYVHLFPAEFRSAPLSYLLALSGGGGEGVVELIKVFRTVGFQFAQVAPLFQLFDEETNRQMQRVKDQTVPLSHLEIVQEARKHLSEEDFNKIEKFDHVLNSGSIKTVVLVKLKGKDRYAVLYLVSPNAAAQIDYNLDLSQEFIEGLKKVGIESSSPLFQLLIDGLRGRMKRELRMDIETELTDLARQSVNQFLVENASLVPAQWTVQVAQPESGTTVAKNAALYKYFTGNTLRYWREEIKAGRLTDPKKIDILKQVNRLVFGSAIFDFFRNSIFDPDRHIGNILVDFDNRIISFIDYGKLEDLREKSHNRDSRMVVAQFLGAMKDRDAHAVAEAALLMSKSGKLSDAKSERLITQLEQHLKNLKKDQTIDNHLIHTVLSLCAANGVAFEPRFLLGIFKGLLMLFGENYVDENTATQIVTEEIVRLYKRMPFDFVSFQAKHYFNMARNALSWGSSKEENPIIATIPSSRSRQLPFNRHQSCRKLLGQGG